MIKHYFIPVYLYAGYDERILNLTYQEIIPKLSYNLNGITLKPLDSFMRSPYSLGKMMTFISKHCLLDSFGFDMSGYNCTQKVENCFKTLYANIDDLSSIKHFYISTFDNNNGL